MDPSDFSAQNHLWKDSVIVCAASLAGSFLLLLIRIYSRVTVAAGRSRPQALGWDDKLIMIAWVPVAAMSALNIYLSCKMMSTTPVGNHRVGEMNFATQICWVLSLWATTWSVLAGYGRTFKEFITTRGEKRKLVIPAILIFVWAILIFVIAGEGKHVDRYWLSGPDLAYKIRISVTTLVNVVVELVVLLVVIPWIFWEKRNWKWRLVFIFLFLTGAAAIALSVLRYVYLEKRLKLYQKSKEKGFEDGNLGIIAVMLSILEANVAIVCACLPTLRYYSWYTWWSARYHTLIEWLWENEDGKVSGQELRIQTVGPRRPKRVGSGETPSPPFPPHLSDVHYSPGELEAPDPTCSPALPFIPRLPSAERYEMEDFEMNNLHHNEMPWRNV